MRWRVRCKQGRLATLKYPDTNRPSGSTTGATYVYCYDSMSRPSLMKQGGTCSSGGTTLVNNVTYGPAGELLTMTYGGYNEARSYNILYQLTRLTDTPTGGGSAVVDFEYTFPTAHATNGNNGKITKMKDHVTGEEVNYQYDALNRLLSAETTSSAWGQAYTFDGFNNLLTQTVTKGSAFSYSVSVDASTNRLTAQQAHRQNQHLHRSRRVHLLQGEPTHRDLRVHSRLETLLKMDGPGASNAPRETGGRFRVVPFLQQCVTADWVWNLQVQLSFWLLTAL